VVIEPLRPLVRQSGPHRQVTTRHLTTR